VARHRSGPHSPSSLISSALEQLSDLPAGDRVLLAGRWPCLPDYLARVPDPRDPRGVRHTLTSLLMAAVAAVLAGARSFTALGDWVADALLEPLDLAGCVVFADAMHTQRPQAEFLITEKNAHYIAVVKRNQPGLYAQVKNLPWPNIPAGARQRDRGHGREEQRTLKAAAVATGLAFPHAAQAICLTRRIRP